MTTPVEENLYRAKATFPPGNPWATPWLSKTAAIAAADKFVRDWLDIGVKAEATVFYRDGSATYHAPKPNTQRYNLTPDFNENDCSGTFDGHQVTSDCDPGL